MSPLVRVKPCGDDDVLRPNGLSVLETFDTFGTGLGLALRFSGPGWIEGIPVLDHHRWFLFLEKIAHCTQIYYYN